MRQVPRLEARYDKQVPIFLAATLLALVAGTALVFSPLVVAFIGGGLVLVLLFVLVPRSSFFSDARLPSLGYNRLLFWLLLINVPTFTEFDISGLTREHGLINPSSISRVASFGVVAFLFLAGQAASRFGQIASAPKQSLFPVFRLLLLLYGYYAVHAFFVLRGMELYLALYRVAEWGLFFLLIGTIFSEGRKLGKDSADEQIKTVLPIVLFPIAAVLVELIIAPGSAYQVSEETGNARLSGIWGHPNVLGLLSTLAIFYVLEYWKKYKWLAVAVLTTVMLFTYSRGALMGLLLTLPVYVFLRTRSASARAFCVVGAGLALGVVLAFSDKSYDFVTQYMQRGQDDISAITTLSARTVTWTAAWQMIQQEPLVGYGFVSGVKRLEEVVALMPMGQWYRPWHAHNEFIQAQLSGGILATLLVFAITLRMAYLLLRLSNRIEHRAWLTLLTWFILITIYGLLTPVLSTPAAFPSAVYAFTYLVLEYQNIRTKPRPTPSSRR